MAHVQYQPPFTLNGSILSLVTEIAQSVGRLSAQPEHANALRLRRINRIRTVQGSLAIEGNTLSEEQITAILDRKREMHWPFTSSWRLGNPRVNSICLMLTRC